MITDEERLPPAVRDLARRLGATGGKRGDIHLTQSGRMRQDASAGWMKFRARQTISTTSCAFEWRARAGPAGVIAVRDALVDGEGALDVRALGFIPIAHIGSTPAITRGELMRYLAELALAPQTILGNAGLRWRSNGPDQLMVSAGVGDATAEVTLDLDGEGRIAAVFAEDRPRAVKADTVATPWRGRFSDYRQHLGFWLPFAAAVSWIVDGTEFVYWEARMETWEEQKSAIG